MTPETAKRADPATAELEWLLRHAETEDLDTLVDYITDKGEGRVALDGDVCKRLVACKGIKGLYNHEDREIIAREIRLFGGSTLVNMFRGDGVEYAEVVRDVAKHLKVNFSSEATTLSLEQGILAKLVDSAFQDMTAEQQKALLEELNIVNLSAAGPGAAILALGLGRAGGFATYQMAVVVANAIARAVLGRGLPFVAGPVISKGLGVLLGPIGWAVTAAWGLADISGAAYRVTVPCVVHIAYIRQKLIAARNSAACPSCKAPNAVASKFCGECGQPLSKAA